MPRVLAVFGATGQQGGSIVSHVLKDAELSRQYKIRALTRDPSNTSAQALTKLDVEVVQADLNDALSLHDAMKGAHTVFALTIPTFGPNAKVQEVTRGKAMADIAVAEGLQYIIFSTLPHVTTVSGGKYTKVAAWDAQAEIEEYIRSLPIKSAFFSPGSFMRNYQTIMGPRPTESGSYVISRPVSPKSQLPLIDTAGDTGKYVGAILAEPDKYEGKVFCAASAVYSMEQIAQIVSKVSGKTVTFEQVSAESFLQGLPPWGSMLIEMMLFQQEFGYYGPRTKELVAWAVGNARGKVHTFEEYLTEQPLQFQ
ncbi:NmrA-like domain-containing protein 1 [Xylographa parallela]|nr:NmrA-like domain-containing protein 1 [Xylographa parallela]